MSVGIQVAVSDNRIESGVNLRVLTKICMLAVGRGWCLIVVCRCWWIGSEIDLMLSRVGSG